MTRSTEQLKKDEALKTATHKHMTDAVRTMCKADITPENAFAQIISWSIMNLKANLELNDLQMAMVLSQCLNDANRALQNDEYEIEEADLSK